MQLLKCSGWPPTCKQLCSGQAAVQQGDPAAALAGQVLDQQPGHLASADDAHISICKVVAGQLELRELCCCRADRDSARGDGGLSTHTLACRSTDEGGQAGWSDHVMELTQIGAAALLGAAERAKETAEAKAGEHGKYAAAGFGHRMGKAGDCTHQL